MPPKKLLSVLISLCLALGPLKPAFAAINEPEAMSVNAPALTPFTTPAPILNPAAALEATAPLTAPEAQPAMATPEAAVRAVGSEVGAILTNMAQPHSASAASMHSAGIELESALGRDLVGKAKRRPDGGWRMVRKDDAGWTAHALTSLRHLQKNGIDVPYKNISIGPAGLTASGENSSHHLFSHEELGHLQNLALLQGLALSDKVVQGLVRRHLEEGIAEPLRFSEEESAALGLGFETALTAEQATQIYKENWRKKLEPFLQQLASYFTVPLAEHYALQGKKGIIVAVYPDPNSRSLIIVRSNGLVEKHAIDDHGKIDQKRTVLHKFSAGIDDAFFDPDSHRLGIVHGWGKIAWVNMDDSQPEHSQIAAPLNSNAIHYDPVSRILATTDFDALQLSKLSSDGLMLDKPFQTLESGGNFFFTKAVSDPKGGDFGTLITVGVTGHVEVRPFKADGFLQEKSISSINAFEVGDESALIAVDSESRLLYLCSAESGHGVVLAYPLHNDGRIDERNGFMFAIPRDALPVSHLYVDPKSHSLILFGSNSEIISFNPQPHLAPKKQFPKETFLSVLASVLPDADKELIQSILGSVKSVVINQDGFDLFKGLAATTVTPAFLKQASKTASLKAIPGSFQWFQEAETTLQNRMPKLWQTLNNPVELGGLLLALSLMRLIFDYDMINTQKKASLASTQGELGFKFQWHGINIVPVSESFRRHILYTENKDGLYAVELKMPGEDWDRNLIHPTHFEVASELWRRYPNDPGVVKPLFYGQYKGKARLYGKPFDFNDDERLGLMVYEYQDGKRLRNAVRSGLLNRKDERLRAYVSPAATAIRLHDLEWSGSTQSNNDMHDENIRVLKNGEGVLVGDFGAFERRPLTLDQRREETFNLLGLTPLGFLGLTPEQDRPYSTWFKSLASRVIGRLSKGVCDPAQRRRIRALVREELGLDF